ncbi:MULTISPECIES: nitrate- and nitrite sensing domain-containing protein [unclassified Streptomyces]|uniref:nitrate- and nitrite sensing domain-containing protein n=1 Tax=unclassified Streptomyces TaxID=2593676 RepID=UPI0022500343|nr:MULTISPECIES: nitrate- and nitrite sensing domain-containing protein [unclassified Streptomyces]MCX4988221.1 nitrate- and nitrite sensing domain-containing protein [Streptomyces sp. NBC_00568]MCX5006574.1 nitrate- and nitrite sensing domain-containing protein [Streptomyces sp. NBC_00638]
MQGRFKRDGSASAEPEPRGGTDRGSSPQHAQNPGPAEVGGSGEHSARPGAKPKAPATTPAAKPTSTPSHGSRVALRNWRISTRLVSLLALPVVAATSLGALRINQSMDDIQQLDNMKLLTEMTKQATELAVALQEERDQSAGPLAHGAPANDYTVKGVRDDTDLAKKHFLQGTQDIDDATANGQLSGVRDSLVGIAEQLNKLSSIRNEAYNDPENSTQTVEAYHRLITGLLALSQDMAEATSNPEMIQRTRALAAFSSAKEYASVQRAVIAAALPERPTVFGTLSKNDQLYAQSALASQQSEVSGFKNIYGDGSADLLKPIEVDNPTIQATDKYAVRVLGSRDGLKTQDKQSYKDWIDDDSAKIDKMSTIETTLLGEMEQKARQLRNESQSEAIVSGVLILLVLGVSLVGAFVVARSMIRSLRRLQDTATKVAQERLPELVKQLSESDPQDVDTSVESVGVHSRDEIGQVAAAFDDVHREAVRLAAEQALLRGNVNAMFTNLSRRSQGLIQRQLSLISELESREADPDQLSSLFKLDHLATRMRRNGENLLVLAGEEPGRRWTRPVPLVDVLRAAASEVEQYERIELSSVPTTEVAGRVVNDLVHLLAELLENATSFSSPQTKVKVTGHALPDGRVLIEIHDTGIGLSPEDLAAINERLAAPPTVDVSVSRRMGLFVVGRLSQRHGIRIQLRPSDSGGTTALVMLPVDVAQGGKKPMPNKPGQGAPSVGGPAAAQASAGVAAARRGNGPQGGPSLGAGAPAAPGGPLGAPPQRGQVGAGQGPRAALPTSNQGGRPGAPGGARGPQGGPGAGQQGRPAPAGAGAGAFGQSPQGYQGQNGSPQQGFGNGSGSQNTFGDTSGARQNAFGDSGPAAATPPQAPTSGKGSRRRPQLPGRGGARAELPGGNNGSRTPSWSDENAQPPVPRSALDTPRGHEDPDATSRMPRIDDRQGPASTSEFARPDFDAPRPGASAPQNNGQHTGQYQRPDSYGPGNPSSVGHNPAGTGQFTTQGYGASQDPSSTGQFARPGYGTSQDPTSTGQFATPGYGNGQDSSSTGQYERPSTPQPPVRPQEPETLPPASGPGDGRTPLFDTLETNWFHGQADGGAPANGVPQNNGSQVSSQVVPQQPQTPPAPQQRPAAAPATASWRSSPNDDLVKQAERARKPSAGGVTTSGLPRRVPRANLVAGTAQQQQHQSGPQVSRAPDDVRGRLTNLRRGIQQGRQAAPNGQTGSFPSPTHQQER